MDHRLTREEAKNLKIGEILSKLAKKEKNSEFVEKLFGEFQVAWQKIAKIDAKFADQPPKLSIQKTDPIAFVLPDKAEKGYGMHIASALEQLS
mmetsp:Transcript_11081/g.9490  ORF Transcript_11081/g.9490 Transcript_11081/m.9490 type:complete len:93 (+) Transcript_11081:267-545(+)